MRSQTAQRGPSVGQGRVDNASVHMMRALVLLCLSDSPFRYSSSRRPLMFFNLLLSHGSLLTFLGSGPFTVPSMSSSLSSEDIYFSASGDEKISLAFALSVSVRDVVDFCRVESRLASF